MTAVTRRPAFWVAYALAAALCTALAVVLFPLAIPIVNLDIKLSADEAVGKARAVATERALIPAGARAAARFAHDRATQNYVELEGGGKTAFAALVAGDVYAPYWWEVRLFVPGEITETLVRLRPDGALRGFTQHVPEAQVPKAPEGLALDAARAQSLAEERARDQWGVPLDAYRLLEKTQQTRTTGRVDHLFTYERTSGHPGEARVRLRLAVAGDALVEATPYVHVPESFQRRYEELRSANNTLAGIASIAAALLYGIGGCILGTVWLARRRWLVWRPALVAGLVVGGLVGASVLANLPAAWFGYDTAQATTTFWIRYVGRSVATAVSTGLGFALVFMAAESLSRRAFPAHPQLWRLWSRDAAPTPQVLGRTLGGYLFVPIALALIAAFYYATNRWLGWWQPSEALTDPNVLGSAIPALTPVAISLQAGFMEECLFRAVPLSLAALIGAHFGRRTLAIAIAVVVQALVFGGAHANYPGFPYYSRLVELMVPSVLWALIFLRFGLLPTILLHALFDLALFAIPLFLVDAPGAGAQRLLVVAAGLVPIAIVLAQRVRAGGWREIVPAATNGGWKIAEAGAEASHAQAAIDPGVTAWAARFQRLLPLLGALALALWIVVAPYRVDVPGISIERRDALAAADAALAQRGVTLGPEWRRSAIVKLARDDDAQWLAHRFVYREAGRDAYRAVVGDILAPPLWEVRYARFEGDVADRAEEWRVTINGDGTLRQVRHALPESRAGARLSREAARELALRTVKPAFGRDPAALREVGADERALPARTDWAFTFADPRIAVGAGGEARLVVTIAGDEIVGAGRYVHVPESWRRAERERASRFTLARFGIGGLAIAATIAALVFGVVAWTRGRSDRRALAGVAAAAFALSLAAAANQWPAVTSAFSTAEPVASQATLAVLRFVAGSLVAALVFGLVAGVGVFSAVGRPAAPLAGRWPSWACGIAAALLVGGVSAALVRFAPRDAPNWPDLALLSLASPAAGAAIAGAQTLIACGGALFLLLVFERLTGNWHRRRWIAAALMVALVGAAGLLSADPLPAMARAATGALVLLVVLFGLLRYNAKAVPAYVATGVTLDFVEDALAGGWPGALWHVVIAAIFAAVAAWIATRYIARARTVAADDGPAASVPATR